jgi:hypothetical protein
VKGAGAEIAIDSVLMELAVEHDLHLARIRLVRGDEPRRVAAGPMRRPGP